MPIPKDMLDAILKHEKWIDDNKTIDRIIARDKKKEKINRQASKERLGAQGDKRK